MHVQASLCQTWSETILLVFHDALKSFVYFQLVEEARNILGVDETADKFKVDRSFSEDFDDFG